jgi:hypothetical protein
MRNAYLWLLLFASLAITGCQSPARTIPRGKFRLPEDSFMTVKRIEKLVPAGMPIEQAREVMELHGFVCTYDEVVGIPHLQCNQIKRQFLWPFNGEWMATIYYEHGLVKSVQARYDLNPVEVGTCVPKRTALKAQEIDRAKDAHAQAHEEHLDAPPPTDGFVLGADMGAEEVPTPPMAPAPGPQGDAATVPVEIP